MEKFSKSFKDKRRWQLSLRRYILEQQRSYDYAPYFGLDNKNLKQWIEIQFKETMRWSNYAAVWQLDHVVPIAFFDFEMEEDLRLCWNFINLKPEMIDTELPKEIKQGVLGAKSYFETLYKHTNFNLCLKMIEKIIQIEQLKQSNINPQTLFLQENKSYLESIQSFNAEEYVMLNKGIEIKDILFQREIFKKYAK
jgi:hypothetical protein